MNIQLSGHFLKAPVLILCILLIQGCATSYQSKGLTGGFKELQLEENVYRVSFRGNGYTDMQRASDFTLLRSAEITLKNGYKYFSVIDEDSYNKVSTITTPERSYTTGGLTSNGYYSSLNATTTTHAATTKTTIRPRSTNTIMMFNEKPKGVHSYNAAFLSNSIRTSYKL